MRDASPPTGWIEVLTQVENALAQVAQDATAREQLFARGTPHELAPLPATGCEAILRRVAERLTALEVGVARAGRVCGHVEAILRDEAEAVEDWCRRSRATGERLANEASRPV